MINKIHKPLFFCLILFSLSIKAQISWVYDIETATSLALQQNKFIIVDFWADWCAPCHQMKKELWDTKQFKPYADKFIFVSINDKFKNQYTFKNKIYVDVYPTVIMMDVFHNPLWIKKGFRSSVSYLKTFENLPEDASGINKIYINKLSDTFSSNRIESLMLGKAYQQIAEGIKSHYIKKSILNASDSSFRQVTKIKVKDSIFEEAMKGKSRNKIVLKSKIK